MSSNEVNNLSSNEKKLKIGLRFDEAATVCWRSSFFVTQCILTTRCFWFLSSRSSLAKGSDVLEPCTHFIEHVISHGDEDDGSGVHLTPVCVIVFSTRLCARTEHSVTVSLSALFAGQVI